MVRAFLFAVALLATPALTHAQTKIVQMYGNFNGTQFTISAYTLGAGWSGAGKLTAPNGSYYNLTVKNGAIRGTMAGLQGVVTVPGSTATTTFSVYGDSSTGAIQLSYLGGNGTPVTLTTKGTVSIK